MYTYTDKRKRKKEHMLTVCGPTHTLTQTSMGQISVGWKNHV